MSRDHAETARDRRSSGGASGQAMEQKRPPLRRLVAESLELPEMMFRQVDGEGCVKIED